MDTNLNHRAVGSDSGQLLADSALAWYDKLTGYWCVLFHNWTVPMMRRQVCLDCGRRWVFELWG